MKTTTRPAGAVPERRSLRSRTHREEQMLTTYLDAAINAGAERRREQAAFVAQGVAVRKQASRDNDYVGVDAAIDDFEYRLAEARKGR